MATQSQPTTVMATVLEHAGLRMRELMESDPEIRARIPDPAVTAAIKAPGLSYREVIRRTLTGYADRQALGTRRYQVVTGRDGSAVRQYEPHFDTISYRELHERILAIAAFWRHHPVHAAAPGELVAFIAFTGAEMATIDLACNFALTVSVPLQANLPAADMQAIMADTAPVTIAASIDNLDIAVDAALAQGSVRSIIVMDYDARVTAESESMARADDRLSGAGGGAGRKVALIPFAEAVAYGREHPCAPLPEPEAGTDHVSMIMYTSGSTGTPKGAIIHDAISAQFWNEVIPVYMPTTIVAYAPMNHFMGRNMVHAALAQGGTAHFTLRSDMSTLFEDFRIVRPTAILFIPRVCELIYQHYQSEVQRLIAGGEEPAAADAAVRARMRSSYLGDRLCGGGVGSSPTAPEVRRFISECWDMPLIEGYGCTEAGAAAMTSQNRLTPTMITQFRLSDVPELGYYTTDKPYPRGELLVKTSKMFKGYFKRPDATASVFTEDGFLRTGDIMEQRADDELVWVDRRNNVIKLSQAEFVAVGPLETTYLGNSALIEQIFLYGSSYRSYLLAVVVPDMAVARATLGRDPEAAELRQLVLNEFKMVARKAELKNFEIPRDLILELEPFTYENGLLSSARKPLRPNIKRRYQDRLEALYEEMDRQQQVELARLRESSEGTIEDRIAGAFKANLGLPAIDPSDARSYGDLGGDSLGAVGLSLLFEEMFAVSVPVSAVLHPAASVSWLAALVTRLQSGSGVQFHEVHPNPAVLAPADLKLHKFLDETTLTDASSAAPPVDLARTILLTGANGFLGRFLCLDWLEHAARHGGKVCCIARGRDEEAARRRLEGVFDQGDPALLDRFRLLAAAHLEILPGDLAQPFLGLGREVFDRLCEEVDQIVHPAALVNHRLSYLNLFEPNVVGTAELVRLAITRRLKRFDYVSTVAVPHMLPSLTSAPEATDVRGITDPVPLTDGYASGYGASKWAGEVLLREAHALYGLPVNVFRPNMILPHAHYVGQYNDTDMITRLLYSMVRTGLAPRSFYQTTGDAARAHYDGLPVDFLAAVMQQIGARPYRGFHTYNMVNHHDDGVSLDSFADWVESAGYPLARLSDHGEWLRRFEDKLRNLPEEQRSISSINILGHFSRPHHTAPSGLSSADFVAAVETVPVGPALPHLSEAYIHKYLADMRARGLIEPAVVDAA
ncbi:MAG: carboxylic acid reductase [Novosphingobium sp.]